MPTSRIYVGRVLVCQRLDTPRALAAASAALVRVLIIARSFSASALDALKVLGCCPRLADNQFHSLAFHVEGCAEVSVS